MWLSYVQYCCVKNSAHSDYHNVFDFFLPVLLTGKIRMITRNRHVYEVESCWSVMAYGDARDGKRIGNWRMECVTSTLHTTSQHGVSSITIADAHTPAASSRLNGCPHPFKWTRPFRRKTKSGFCACVITFQTQSSSCCSTAKQRFSVLIFSRQTHTKQHILYQTFRFSSLRLNNFNKWHNFPGSGCKTSNTPATFRPGFNLNSLEIQMFAKRHSKPKYSTLPSKSKTSA